MTNLRPLMSWGVIRMRTFFWPGCNVPLVGTKFTG